MRRRKNSARRGPRIGTSRAHEQPRLCAAVGQSEWRCSLSRNFLLFGSKSMRMDSQGDPDDSDWLHRALRHARWRTLDARFAGPLEAPAEAVAPAATTTTDANGDDASAADAAADDDEEAAASAATWESLPDDLLEIVVRYILAIDTRAAIRFCSASATLWRRLWEVRQHACQERMLRWLPEQTVAHVIDAEGRTVTADGDSDGDTFYIDDDGRRHSWAAGTLLPAVGVTEWSILINECKGGRMVLGVCDEDGRCGWGIEPYSGLLRRYTRDKDGRTHLRLSSADASLAPPPPGCPDGEGLRLMTANLRGKAAGSVVEFRLDADAGALSFTVDELGCARERKPTDALYPRPRVLSGFRPHARLRPWCLLYLHVGDQVRLSGFVEGHAGPRGGGESWGE